MFLSVSMGVVLLCAFAGLKHGGGFQELDVVTSWGGAESPASHLTAGDRHVEWYVKAHSDIDKAVPFLAGYKPLQPIPPYEPGTKAEKDVQAVIDKIKKESMAERNKALDDARTAALKYHKNVTIHHLSYHYKLNNTLEQITKKLIENAKIIPSNFPDGPFPKHPISEPYNKQIDDARKDGGFKQTAKGETSMDGVKVS